MHSERVIHMEAADRQWNIYRGWRCEIGTDPFGVVLLSVSFGRTGRDGRIVI